MVFCDAFSICCLQILMDLYYAVIVMHLCSLPVFIGCILCGICRNVSSIHLFFDAFPMEMKGPTKKKHKKHEQLVFLLSLEMQMHLVTFPKFTYFEPVCNWIYWGVLSCWYVCVEVMPISAKKCFAFHTIRFWSDNTIQSQRDQQHQRQEKTHTESQLTWQFVSVWYATACASPIWLSYQITTFAMHYNYKTSFLHGVPAHLAATRNIQYTQMRPSVSGIRHLATQFWYVLATSFLCAHSFTFFSSYSLALTFSKLNKNSQYIHYNNTPIQWICSFTFSGNLMTSNCTLLFVSFLFMPLNLNAMLTNKKYLNFSFQKMSRVPVAFFFSLAEFPKCLCICNNEDERVPKNESLSFDIYLEHFLCTEETPTSFEGSKMIHFSVARNRLWIFFFKCLWNVYFVKATIFV